MQMRKSIFSPLVMLLWCVPSLAQEPAAEPAPAEVPPATPTVEGSAPANPPANPVPAPTPNIEPAAAELLEKINRAYAGLSGYRDRLIVRNGEQGPIVVQGYFAWKAPNRFAVTTTAENSGTTRVVSNGTHVFVARSADKAKYLKQPVPSSRDAIHGVRTAGPWLPMLLSGEGLPFKEFPGTGSLTMMAGDTIGGVAVDQLKVALTVESGTLELILAAGRDDHLLRRIITTRNMGGKTQKLTENHLEIGKNPAFSATTFSFTPPKGAKAMSPQEEPPSLDSRLKKGARPFPISDRDTSGKAITLQQYEGKVVLLDFWATWCGPCVFEMPNVIKLYQTYQGRGFDIIGISLDEDRNALRDFVAKNKMPWRQIFDGQGWKNKVAVQYGVQAIPATILVGRDGRIIGVNQRGAELEAAVRSAVAAAPPKK